MKIIIAGSRHFPSEKARRLVTEYMDELCSDQCLPSIEEVVCGGASGIDMAGAWWARQRGISVKMFPADWDRHGRAAGPIRNQEMAEYADALVLIWGGKSRGSADMKRRAKSMILNIFERVVE